MGCGKYSIKDSCGDRYYSTCTFYQTDVPEWSTLKDQNCVTIEETTEELYKEITKIKNNLDTSEIGDDCIVYTGIGTTITQKQINKVHEEEICNLKTAIKNATPTNGMFCQDLNYGTLISPNDCDGKPTTWCEFAQFILNKLKTDQDV